MMDNKYFSAGNSWCITNQVRIRHVEFPLILPYRISKYYLDLSNQFKQNTCSIQLIESFYLKYGIYIPLVVKDHIKYL